MRLNKYISHNTKYSRRDADTLIENGEVKVNGKIINTHGYIVEKGDKVYVKRRAVKRNGDLTMVVYNKPKGVLVTKRDDRGRATIYHKLSGKFRHFIPVGRLDYASEGLLLLTNQPKVADVLMSSNLDRVYNIKIDKPFSKDMEKAMQEGLVIKNSIKGAHEKSKIDTIEFKPFVSYKLRGDSGKYTKLQVTISEGKNRELRRFFAHFGAKVLDLKRVGFGGIFLNNLPTNKTRYFTRREYDDLKLFLKDTKREDTTL